MQVPYVPFLLRPPERRGDFPRRIASRLDAVSVLDVSDPTRCTSLLNEYIADLEFVIYPGCHRNRNGRTFSNVSYYSTSDGLEAVCRFEDGVSWTVVSIGQVRHFAALALEVYQAIQPILFKDAPAAARSTGHSLIDLLRHGASIDDEDFRAVIDEYPGLFNDAGSGARSFESEYLLFADMLRFVWCHEWFHAFAGHAQFASEKLGILRLQEVGDDGSSLAHAATLRAMEFEADSMAIRLMLAQIFSGLDMPGRAVAFQDGLSGRLFWMLLALSVVTTHWVELDRGDCDDFERRHPSAAFRYLNAWDTINVELMKRSRLDVKTSLATTTLSVMHGLGQACVCFAPLADVSPLVHETRTMKRLRADVDVYIHILDGLDFGAMRYGIDFGARESLPVTARARRELASRNPKRRRHV